MLLLLLFITLTVTQNSDEQARALINKAIEAMGGSAYLTIKSERSTGFLTPYREDGQPEKLATQQFIDYIVLPDKERVEFKGQGRRFIQSNSSTHNWTYDSDSNLLKDQSEAELQRFRQGLRFQLDQILRGGYSAAGVKLEYLKRQEIWPRQFAEGVRITYADGEEASLFFDPQTNLPLALRFPRLNAKGEKVVGENRFFKYITVNSVKVPFVVDLFEMDKQVLRVNYNEREFNAQVPDKLFIKPENVKALK